MGFVPTREIEDYWERRDYWSKRIFLFRRPYIWLLVAAIVMVVVYFGLNTLALEYSELTVELLSSEPNQVLVGKNASFTISVQNRDSVPHTMECRFVYSSAQLLLYDNRSGASLAEPTYNGKNYTIVHPISKRLGGGEKLTLTLRVRGLDPGVDSFTYIIVTQIFSDGKFSDQKNLQLTIKR
jgi:hypothetical protein